MSDTTGTIIFGGVYFESPVIRFFDNEIHHENKHRFSDMIRVDWQDLRKGRNVNIPHNDFIFIFGLKKWGRRLHKAKYKPKEIPGIIERFLKNNIKDNIPLGVLDDLNMPNEKGFGESLRNMLFKNFNCKVYLLREYWKGREKYDKRVLPFSIPCLDYTNLAVSPAVKEYDIYFRGNDSSNDRKPIVQEVQKWDEFKKHLIVYSGGDRGGQRIDREKFLKQMANAKFCLNFKGAGYCCFRYQEIPSVGSIPVTPVYPWVVRHDYEDMVNCIRYTNPEEMRDKLTKIISSKNAVEDMSKKTMEHFLKYHTTQARYQWFLEAIDMLK